MQKQTMPMMKKLYAIPDEIDIDLKPMTEKDVHGVCQLLNEGLRYAIGYAVNTQ